MTSETGLGRQPHRPDFEREAGYVVEPPLEVRTAVSDDNGPVLIVDDDPEVRQTISAYFVEHNLPTLVASNGIELERHVAMSGPSLILLDLKLDRENGLDLLRSLRSRSDIPIIIITGRYLGEIDRAVGLELGADGYVEKPFSLRELLARVRTIRRRQTERPTGVLSGQEKAGYRFGGWTLKCDKTRRLLAPDGMGILLTRGEYALLLAFLEAPQRILTRKELLKLSRQREYIDGRSVVIQISRLRRKLEADVNHPRLIKTAHGVGYVFTLPVESF